MKHQWSIYLYRTSGAQEPSVRVLDPIALRKRSLWPLLFDFTNLRKKKKISKYSDVDLHKAKPTCWKHERESCLGNPRSGPHVSCDTREAIILNPRGALTLPRPTALLPTYCARCHYVALYPVSYLLLLTNILRGETEGHYSRSIRDSTFSPTYQGGIESCGSACHLGTTPSLSWLISVFKIPRSVARYLLV